MKPIGTRLVVMASVASDAAFQKRCGELLTGPGDLFMNLQITSFPALAFGVGTLQQPAVKWNMQRFAERVVQVPAPLAEV